MTPPDAKADKNGWMPIETAPVDERLLVFVKRSGLAFGYVREFSDGQRIARAEGHTGDWEIPCWQPLPTPPVEGG